MSRFVDNAVQILDAAEHAAQAGHAPSDLTILITAEGGIHMLAGSDWPLDSLQSHHGARMVYRISQKASGVQVEGRSGSRICRLEAANPARLLQRPLPHALLSCG